MNADTASNDHHLVLGKSPGLVGADHQDIGHRLTRSTHADQ